MCRYNDRFLPVFTDFTYFKPSTGISQYEDGLMQNNGNMAELVNIPQICYDSKDMKA